MFTMTDVMSTPMTGMDMDAMQRCMEACSACEQACTMCADSMVGDDMRMAMSMCLSCADMAGTTMRMMLRPMAMHTASMIAMHEAMIRMAGACADECLKHADHMPSMAMCAQACRECVLACQAMVPSGHGTGTSSAAL
jgi:hypothetical protein